MGNVLTIPEPEVPEARKLYLARYANSQYWVDFEDFSFYRMDVVDVYYVGGFGVMGWVSNADYEHARPDPLADTAGEIIQHMNADHKDALILLARAFARSESQEATMTAVDRLGFHVRLKTQDGMRGARIILARSEQPGRDQKGSGRVGAAGALASVMSVGRIAIKATQSGPLTKSITSRAASRVTDFGSNDLGVGGLTDEESVVEGLEGHSLKTPKASGSKRRRPKIVGP
jgi:hypothetical protein